MILHGSAANSSMALDNFSNSSSLQRPHPSTNVTRQTLVSHETKNTENGNGGRLTLKMEKLEKHQKS
jgi:hypothetical protein